MKLLPCFTKIAPVVSALVLVGVYVSFKAAATGPGSVPRSAGETLNPMAKITVPQPSARPTGARAWEPGSRTDMVQGSATVVVEPALKSPEALSAQPAPFAAPESRSVIMTSSKSSTMFDTLAPAQASGDSEVQLATPETRVDVQPSRSVLMVGSKSGLIFSDPAQRPPLGNLDVQARNLSARTITLGGALQPLVAAPTPELAEAEAQLSRLTIMGDPKSGSLLSNLAPMQPDGEREFLSVGQGSYVSNSDTSAILTTASMLSTTTTASSHVGSYAITASGVAAPDYKITCAQGMLTVRPAPLTITADNQSKANESARPTLWASYSGFVVPAPPRRSSALAPPSDQTPTAEPLRRSVIMGSSKSGGMF
jgi:hypothetical protein